MEPTVTPGPSEQQPNPNQAPTPSIFPPSGQPGEQMGPQQFGGQFGSRPQQPVVSGGITGAGLSAPAGSKWKMPLIIATIMVVVIGGSAAAYYGYYKSPNTVWKQALQNTGAGYDKLVSYADSQAKTKYKSGKLDGTFKVVSSGVTADGTIHAVGDGSNSDATLSIGASGVRVNAELRTLKAANSTNPDVYFKVNGLQGLSTLFGNSSASSTLGSLGSLDNQWFSIDHTLFDQYESNAHIKSDGSTSLPKEADVIDAAKSVSKVNKQYLFSTSSKTAVFTKVQKVNSEQHNGRATYHYHTTVNKDHLAAYLEATFKAVDSSKLGPWIKDTSGKMATDNADLTQIKKDIADQKVSQLDVWVDTGTRTVQTIRIPDSTDAANNYVDLSLNYTGGSKYPFVISSHDKNGSEVNTAEMTITLDTQTHSIGLKGNFTNKGSSTTVATFDLTGEPSTDTVKVTAPSGAKSLIDLFGGLPAGSGDNSLTDNNSLSADLTAAHASNLNSLLQTATKF